MPTIGGIFYPEESTSSVPTASIQQMAESIDARLRQIAGRVIQVADSDIAVLGFSTADTRIVARIPVLDPGFPYTLTVGGRFELVFTDGTGHGGRVDSEIRVGAPGEGEFGQMITRGLMSQSPDWSAAPWQCFAPTKSTATLTGDREVVMQGYIPYGTANWGTTSYNRVLYIFQAFAGDE